MGNLETMAGKETLEKQLETADLQRVLAIYREVYQGTKDDVIRKFKSVKTEEGAEALQKLAKDVGELNGRQPESMTVLDREKIVLSLAIKRLDPVRKKIIALLKAGEEGKVLETNVFHEQKIKQIRKDLKDLPDEVTDILEREIMASYLTEGHEKRGGDIVSQFVNLEALLKHPPESARKKILPIFFNELNQHGDFMREVWDNRVTKENFSGKTFAFYTAYVSRITEKYPDERGKLLVDEVAYRQLCEEGNSEGWLKIYSDLKAALPKDMKYEEGLEAFGAASIPFESRNFPITGAIVNLASGGMEFVEGVAKNQVMPLRDATITSLIKGGLKLVGALTVFIHLLSLGASETVHLWKAFKKLIARDFHGVKEELFTGHETNMWKDFKAFALSSKSLTTAFACYVATGGLDPDLWNDRMRKVWNTAGNEIEEQIPKIYAEKATETLSRFGSFVKEKVVNLGSGIKETVLVYLFDPANGAWIWTKEQWKNAEQLIETQRGRAFQAFDDYKAHMDVVSALRDEGSKTLKEQGIRDIQLSMQNFDVKKFNAFLKANKDRFNTTNPDHIQSFDAEVLFSMGFITEQEKTVLKEKKISIPLSGLQTKLSQQAEWLDQP